MTSELYKSFRPSGAATVVLILLTILFAGLGTWQIMRSVEKANMEQQYQAAPVLSYEQAISRGSRFAQVQVLGHYDLNRHFLLDNQIWNGRAGVFVFTPFYTVSGTTILVNRGWLPLAADRKSMPEIPTPQENITITGMLNTAPVPGRILGQADALKTDSWPQLVTYLNLVDVSKTLDIQLEDWIVQLAKSDLTGFEGREWKPVFMSSTRHKAYAFQWFALAAASIIMWISIGFTKRSGNFK